MIQRWRRDESSSQAKKGILLAVGGNTADQGAVRAVALATKGAKPGVPVYAVHVIEMPWTEAVDEPPGDPAIRDADQALEHARAEATAIGCSLEVEILQARTAGAAIVDEAAERNCSLIVLGMPNKERHGSFDMGSTIPYVLGHAAMQVWVVREPRP